jgi:hypothetical protein
VRVPVGTRLEDELTVPATSSKVRPFAQAADNRGEAMDWRLTVRRLLISVFLIVHLSATVLWVLPPCPLKQRTIGLVSYYILPLGLWQYWTMFSPDPVRNTFTLEAEVVDAKGLRAVFAFPKLADYTTNTPRATSFVSSTCPPTPTRWKSSCFTRFARRHRRESRST